MQGRMEGKVALITGAARGQGRSHAVRWRRRARTSSRLTCAAQIPNVPYPMSTEADLAETARLVEQLDRRVVAQVADVRDRGPLAAAVAAGVAALGQLDVVVANAGIIPLGSDVPPVAFLDTVSVRPGWRHQHCRGRVPAPWPGCVGHLHRLHGVADARRHRRGSGHRRCTPTPKRGVARFTHDLALVLARHNIRVNAVHPGNIDTDMLQNEAMYRTFRPDLEHPGREERRAGGRPYAQAPRQHPRPGRHQRGRPLPASDPFRYVTGLQLRVDAGDSCR